VLLPRVGARFNGSGVDFISRTYPFLHVCTRKKENKLRKVNKNNDVL
jgi:hypothetical protein